MDEDMRVCALHMSQVKLSKQARSKAVPIGRVIGKQNSNLFIQEEKKRDAYSVCEFIHVASEGKEE